jgi:integrase
MLPATPHPSMPVWPGRGGKELAEHSATQAAARAFVRADLTDAAGKATATLHDLRRTCGSLMLSRGVPLIVVSRHLGHATPLVTARVYAHLLRDDQLAAVPAAFEEALRAPRSQQARNNRDA